MLYSDGKGKYEKAYGYLLKKMIPESGRASNPLGEALRLVSRVYYRRSNDGDSYGECIEYGMVPDFSERKFPFDKEYAALGRELDSHLSSDSGYDKAVDLVLLHIMLNLSSESNIYNPETNRLVPLNSAAGEKALKALDLNRVFINYCGKNEEWLPETLRKEGVKITKVLSEETRKELKCDTVQEEFYREDKSGYVKRKPVKVTLSKDNTILSKKFSRIAAEHKKSVKAAEKKQRDLQLMRAKKQKQSLKTQAKNFNETKLYYEQLRDMTVSKRADVLQKMGKKSEKNIMIKMLVAVFIQYKVKKVTTKAQRENRAEVLARLVKGLNDAGKDISNVLARHSPEDTIYIDLDPSLNKRLDDMLVEILGDSEAVDRVYNSVRYD